MQSTVRWRGQTADYTTAERLLMADLPVREQAFVHTLKALTQGEIAEAAKSSEGGTGDRRMTEPRPNVSGAEDRASSVAESETIRSATQSRDAVPEKVPPVYTNPEDLEFGSVCGTGKQRSSRKRPIYAVAWTWRKHKIHKTKKRCEQRLKVWKRWYERQGWTVRRMGTGYWADGPDGEKHVISLHEYDARTKERLN